MADDGFTCDKSPTGEHVPRHDPTSTTTVTCVYCEASIG